MTEATYEIDENVFNHLVSDPNTLHHCFKKFIEMLIRHVLWNLKNEALLPVYDDSALFVVDLFRDDIGDAVCLLIDFIDQDIGELYEGIKEKIKIKMNLKSFISRLADHTFGSSSHQLLFFLAIVAGIFTRANTELLSTKVSYIEITSEVLEKNKAQIMAMGGFESMNRLVTDLLQNSDVLEEFRGLKCGKASDYF